uniref:Uncharacterized protein n=1 Tax=Magallana gigas TaxID=29159 RepID=A0A8W8JJ32_MAGGI
MAECWVTQRSKVNEKKGLVIRRLKTTVKERFVFKMIAVFTVVLLMALGQLSPAEGAVDQNAKWNQLLTILNKASLGAKISSPPKTKTKPTTTRSGNPKLFFQTQAALGVDITAAGRTNTPRKAVAAKPVQAGVPVPPLPPGLLMSDTIPQKDSEDDD